MVKCPNAPMQPFLLLGPLGLLLPIWVSQLAHLLEIGNHSLSPRQLPVWPTSGRSPILRLDDMVDGEELRSESSKFNIIANRWILFMFDAGRMKEKNIYFWHHLYHHDHGGRLIPARYVVPKINQYIFFTFGSLFGSKSECCCDP